MQYKMTVDHDTPGVSIIAAILIAGREHQSTNGTTDFGRAIKDAVTIIQESGEAIAETLPPEKVEDPNDD